MINSLAVVETNLVGEDVTIKEFVIIRKDVRIGNRVVIHPNVVIEEGVVIGDDTEIFPGSYLGKIPKGVGATSRPIVYNPRLTIGANCSIGPHSVIYYDVDISHNTLVGDGVSIREGSRIGSYCIIGRHVTLNYNVLVGDHVKIMDHSWLAGNMIVGDDVFISGGVLTANDNDIGNQGYSDEHVIGPRIKDSARIGVGAIILPQVTIGENAVVAAGGVVTKDVAPYDLVMGIPAKYVRKLE